MALTPRQTELQKKFEENNIWNESWESILLLDADYFEAYSNWQAVPHIQRHLPPKVQHFIHLTVSAAATHLHAPGIRAHIQGALSAGATQDEIMEILELASTVSIHACNIGVPVLLEVMEEEGLRKGPTPYDAYQERLKEEFTKNRGYWHQFWEEFLELDPRFFEGYAAYSSVPWKKGTLEPKYKELCYCAFDAAATHLYKPGLKLHMINAIRLGCTPQQIMEVLEIAALLGIHGVTTGAPILREEVAKYQSKQ